MDENKIAYWHNRAEDKFSKIDLRGDSYIVTIVISNQYTNSIYNRIIPCNSKTRLFGFLKYVVLPSIVLSNILVKEDKRITLNAFSDQEIFTLIDTIDIEVDVKNKWREFYVRYINLFEELEKEKINITSLKELTNKIQLECDYRNGVIIGLEVYESPEDFGLSLIESYREEEMVDYLEESLDMMEAEIEELFTNIENNKIIIPKLEEFILNNYGLLD